jgi:hypothetical protein
MPTPPRTDAALLEVLEVYERLGGIHATVLETGKSAATVKRFLAEARKRGLHLSDGAKQAMDAVNLNGSEIAGGWRHAYDDEGKKVESVRWSVPKQATEDVLERIREAFEGIEPAKPVAPPDTSDDDMLGFFPHADLHLGMVINSDQSGGEEYNQQLAVERFRAGSSACITGVPRCAIALIVNAGDAMHANDDSDRTPRSGHKLKVEGTHHQNLGVCIELNAFSIDLALQYHSQVVYRAIGGNHDPNIPAPILYALRERYRNEPRVNIVVTEDEFWQLNWGRAFLCGHHGHNRKPKEVCAELPGKYPKAWGAAEEWHYFSAHYHNYQSVPYGPTRHHQLPAVCAMDTHSAWAPYSGIAGMMAMTFHKKYGLKNTLYVGL